MEMIGAECVNWTSEIGGCRNANADLQVIARGLLGGNPQGMKRIALLCLLILTACSTGPASSPDLPPAGAIWFGTSFDAKTLAITGKTTSIKLGTPAMAVVNVGKSVTVADLHLRFVVDGGKPNPNMDIKSDTVGATFGLKFGTIGTAGKWRFEVLDKGGKLLASGTLTVT
jgi:hypothetical protein